MLLGVSRGVRGAPPPASMALHNLALNLGIMAGSLAGPLLVEMIGLREALLLGAGLRLLGGLLMIWWG